MKKRSKYFLVSFLFILLLAACGPKPDEVALELAEAVNAQDVDQALALFAEDAVVTSVSPEPFSGKAEIRGWLEGMIADDFKLEAEIAEVSGNKVVEHDTMTMDSMSFFGIEPLTGTSELIVEDGKIQTINFGFSEETLTDLQAAPFVAQEDLIGIWYVGSFMEIYNDGTARVADKQADLKKPVDDAHPGSQEVWTYDGMVMTMQATEPGVGEGYSCTPDEVGVYLVRWAGDDLDKLKFEAVDDQCGSRMGGMMWGHWKPIESQDATAMPAAVTELPAPQEVVVALGETLNASDLDGAMALIADDIVFDVNGELNEGMDEVQALFEELIAGDFRIEQEVAGFDGRTVTSKTATWGAGIPPEAEPLQAVEEYVVEEGKIARITWTPTEESAAKLMAAMAKFQAMEVISAANEAWNAGDVDTLKSLYAADADVCFPDFGPECTSGEEEIGGWVEELVGLNFVIEPESLEVKGDIVTVVAKVWADPTRALEIAPLVTTDVYTLEDGQIVNQTSALDEESAAKLAAAMEALEEPPADIPESDIVVIIENGTCSMDSLTPLSIGEKSVTLAVRDTANAAYAASFFTLEEGKELHDLIAAQDSPSPPQWADMFSFQDALAGKNKSYSIKIEAGPIYLLCWNDEERVIGKKGPIEVRE